jgi:copper chaperone
MNIELNVTGMTCNHCKAAVEKAIHNVAGVNTAQVDLASGKVSVEGQTLNPDLLIAAVIDEGYGAQLAGA